MGDSAASTQASQPTLSTAGSSSPASQGNGSPVNTGSHATQITVSGGTVSSDPVFLSHALDQIASVVNNALQQVSALNVTQANNGTQQAQQIQNVLGDVLDKQQELAKAVQSGGQTETNKTILSAVGAALLSAVVIVFALGRKRTA
jgi:hypothetical protein